MHAALASYVAMNSTPRLLTMVVQDGRLKESVFYPIISKETHRLQCLQRDRRLVGSKEPIGTLFPKKARAIF